MEALGYFVLSPGHTVHAVLDASGELEKIVRIVLVRHECLLAIALRRRIPEPGSELLIDHLVENRFANRIQIAGCNIQKIKVDDKPS